MKSKAKRDIFYLSFNRKNLNVQEFEKKVRELSAKMGLPMNECVMRLILAVKELEVSYNVILEEPEQKAFLSREESTTDKNDQHRDTLFEALRT